MANEKAGAQHGSASWVIECGSVGDNPQEGRERGVCESD